MAHKQRTPFTLKSGNATAFKNMGSHSPMMKVDATTADATTTIKKTGLGKLPDDVKSLGKGVLDVTKGVLGGTSDALGKIVAPIDDKLNEIKKSNKEKNNKRNIKKGNTKVNESGEKVAMSDMEVQRIKDARMRKTGKSQYQLDQWMLK